MNEIEMLKQIIQLNIINNHKLKIDFYFFFCNVSFKHDLKKYNNFILRKDEYLEQNLTQLLKQQDSTHKPINKCELDF